MRILGTFWRKSARINNKSYFGHNLRKVFTMRNRTHYHFQTNNSMIMIELSFLMFRDALLKELHINGYCSPAVTSWDVITLDVVVFSINPYIDIQHPILIGKDLADLVNYESGGYNYSLMKRKIASVLDQFSARKFSPSLRFIDIFSWHIHVMSPPLSRL